MFEYLFFNTELRDAFVARLQQRGIQPQLSTDPLGQQVAIPDDIDEQLAEEIDGLYDHLLQRQAALLEQTEDRLEKDVTGVNLVLKDGTPCVIRLQPELVGRLLTVINLQELGELVNTIADQVENPDNRPLCHD